MDHFDKLLEDARKIQVGEYHDSSMIDTNAVLNTNVKQIEQTKKTFEGEMQGRFKKLADSTKKLNFKKSKLLEDLDYMLRGQLHDLTKDS